jgi:pimeloyl-ACP methyl ester carboxylesterase
MTQRVPLALLPGLLLDAGLWRAQTAALADIADCRIGDFSSQDNVGDMARSVLAAMPERFALVGLSMGGYVAFEIMRQAPHRVALLALLDTKARLDAPEETSRRRGLIELARKGKFRGVTRMLLPLLVHEDALGDEAVTGEIMAMAERCGRDVFVRQQTAIMSRPDSLPGLGRIACTTLILCGREDVRTPLDCHEEMLQGIHSASLTVIDGCGHLPPLEKPAEVTQALRAWLAAWPHA